VSVEYAQTLQYTKAHQGSSLPLSSQDHLEYHRSLSTSDSEAMDFCQGRATEGQFPKPVDLVCEGRCLPVDALRSAPYDIRVNQVI